MSDHPLPDAERHRLRRIQRRVRGTPEDDESVHSDQADAPTSPTVPHATPLLPSLEFETTIEDIYPSLQAPTRLLRRLTDPNQLQQMITVAPLFLSTTQSILGSFAVDTLLMSCETPVLLHDAVVRTNTHIGDCLRRMSEAMHLAKGDMEEVIALAERILHYLMLLHKASTAFQEKTSAKPLPDLPQDILGNDTEDGGIVLPISPVSFDSGESGQTLLGSSVPGTPSSESSKQAETPKKGKKKFLHRLLKTPLDSDIRNMAQCSNLTLDTLSTPAEDKPFEFHQSRLYDCRDPDEPAQKVDMPMPNIAIRVDTKGQLQAASLPALVFLLTSYQALGFDENMSETFFLSFRLFSSSTALMDVFEARWDEVAPPELTPAQQRVWQRHILHVRNSLAHLIIAWLDDYWRDDKDSCVKYRLRSLIRRFAAGGVIESIARSAKDALKRALRRGQKGETSTRFQRAKAAAALREVPQLVSPIPVNIKGYGIELAGFMSSAGIAQFAEQLAWTSQRHYCQIDPEDLVRLWVAEGPAFCELQKFEEQLLAWANFAVLDEDERPMRVKMLEFWLGVATACVELRNFSSASAIFGALVYAGVERLWKTILELSIPSKEQYRELNELLSGLNNFAVYRRALAAHDLPTVPILAVLRKDVISAKQITGMPLSDGNSQNGEKLINLNAFRKLNTVIQFMESCFVLYKIEQMPAIQTFISQQCRWTPECFAEMQRCTDKRSLLLEPPGPRFIQKGRTWLQTVQGSVDDEHFTVHDLPDPKSLLPPVKKKLFTLGSITLSM
ncbi:ras guanine nucleotide exchange factor domain-containing protein [Mycena amicta]|nr:ras guanine nucleotide exchange factor domain-containing protein [Mycena amicta]